MTYTVVKGRWRSWPFVVSPPLSLVRDFFPEKKVWKTGRKILMDNDRWIRESRKGRWIHLGLFRRWRQGPNLFIWKSPKKKGQRTDLGCRAVSGAGHWQSWVIFLKDARNGPFSLSWIVVPRNFHFRFLQRRVDFDDKRREKFWSGYFPSLFFSQTSQISNSCIDRKLRGSKSPFYFFFALWKEITWTL